MKLTLIQPFGIVLDVITGALYKHRTTYFTSEPKQHRKDAVLREEIKGNCRFEGPKRSKIKEKWCPHTDLNRGPPDYKFDLGRFTELHRKS